MCGGLGWVRQVWGLLPAKYTSQLRALYVLHPTLRLRLLLWALSPLLGRRVWERLVFVDEIAQLGAHFELRALRLPAFVEHYDRNRDTARAHLSPDASERARIAAEQAAARRAEHGPWRAAGADPLLGVSVRGV